MSGDTSNGKTQPATEIPWLVSPERANDFLQTPVKFGMTCYEQWLGTASRVLSDQANHLRNLAECKTPSDVIVCQTEFLQKSVATAIAQMQRSSEALSRAVPVK